MRLKRRQCHGVQAQIPSDGLKFVKLNYVNRSPASQERIGHPIVMRYQRIIIREHCGFVSAPPLVYASVVAVLVIAGCSFPSPNRAPLVRFNGEATDALRLTVRFAPGSLDPATTGVMVLLDTDLDPSTGVRDPGLGADYLVSLHAGPAREATVARAVTDANCARSAAPCRYEPFQHADVVLSNDEMMAVVSRSSFARFDGRLNFRVVAHAIVAGGHQTKTTNHMPNLPAQFIAIR